MLYVIILKMIGKKQTAWDLSQANRVRAINPPYLCIKVGPSETTFPCRGVWFLRTVVLSGPLLGITDSPCVTFGRLH